MSTLLIVNGDVVVGDGKALLEETTVVVENHRITDLLRGRPGRSILDSASKVLEAAGKLVIPGLINGHTHGITLGPLFASGAKPLTQDQAIENLNRHMLEGTTTILSVDGFATMEEVETIDRLHPMRVKTTTSHIHWNLKAADDVDGSGLQDTHRHTSVEGMLASGAVALGEFGAGHTLGGGGQDYMYIPQAVRHRTGRDIVERQARALKRSVLGRYVDPSAFDCIAVRHVLEEIGLDDCLTPEEARDLISATVLPPVRNALEGLREAGDLVDRFGVPAIVHNSAPSKRAVAELAKRGLGSSLIAGHSNHTTFELEEAVLHARDLKARGAVIDLSTFGSFRANEHDEIQMQFSLLEECVVDTISTDYGGGSHDPMLVVLEQATERRLIDLPLAISLLTANVARAIPLLAPNRGLVAKGKEADLVIVDREQISQVETVLIGGQITVEQGQLVPQEGG